MTTTKKYFDIQDLLKRKDVSGLVDALADQSMDVRRAAAEALGKIGEQRAVGPLIKALNDTTDYPVFKVPLQVSCSNIDARCEAALALAKIGGNEATEALQEFSDEGGSKGVYRGLSVKEAVQKALAELGATASGSKGAQSPQRQSLLGKWFGGSKQSAQELIKSAEKLRLSGDLGKAFKLAKKATKTEPGNGYTWMQLGMVHVGTNDVVAATRAFKTAVEAEPALMGSEPGARLAVVYDHLDMGEELVDVCSVLKQAGLGLDPGVEREWEKLVLNANQRKLQSAAGMKKSAAGTRPQVSGQKQIEEMLRVAGASTLSGCQQFHAIAILHERAHTRSETPHQIGQIFLQQYKKQSWVPQAMRLQSATPVKMVHDPAVASLGMSKSNAKMAEILSQLAPKVNIDRCSAICFTGDNPAFGHTCIAILAA